MISLDRDTIINGVLAGASAYVVATVIRDVRHVRRKTQTERKEGAIEIEATLYAAEEVTRRKKEGAYSDMEDISQFLNDLRFFQMTKILELREKYKKI